MIKSSSELTLGMTIWHVYGHIQDADPTEEIITELPQKTSYGEEFFVVHPVDRASHVQSTRFCGDVGLDREGYNHNRIFRTKEAADQFIAECVKQGIRKPFQHHHAEHDEAY